MSVDGRKIQRILDSKNELQKILLVNLGLSLFILVVSTVGRLHERTIQKVMLPVGGLMASASLFTYARQFDNSEEAEAYTVHLNQSDLKEELDSQIAVNQKRREVSEQAYVYLSIEKEFANNPTARMLALESKKAKDQIDDNEPQEDEKTAFDTLQDDITDSAPEPEPQAQLLTDVQFKNIVLMSKRDGNTAKAITLATGYPFDSADFHQARKEFMRRVQNEI